MEKIQLTANYVDLSSEQIYPAMLLIQEGVIVRVDPKGTAADPGLPYVLPGFIDAHVHIESSMLVPSEFARLASVHGTVATVSDPHEIANVLGTAGVDFMINNGKKVPFKFFFGAPSCVPATPFETAGATLDAAAVQALLERKDIYYLSEMMNFPGVLQGDPEVQAKIQAALAAGKPIDGHAPGLRASDARSYAEAGRPGEVTISTDHECFSREEALDKLACGQQILIREGSAARNFDALADLLAEHADRMMFCSDDKHPDSLAAGHINQLVVRALQRGLPLFNVLKAACLNPVRHYDLPVGLLRPGDPADFIVVGNLQDFQVQATYNNGIKTAANGQTCIPRVAVRPINHWTCTPKRPADFHIRLASDQKDISVIAALDGQLITERERWPVMALEDPDAGINLITVVNRYQDQPPAVAFIRNFGLRRGALASSVAHDSHNIIAVGTSADLLCEAVNAIIAAKGGVCAINGADRQVLPLPVAGLMSAEDGYQIARRYGELDQMAKSMGSTLDAPFMTLSFMALLVIPHLKLSDKGLFDGDAFAFVPV